jgi:hypothetical protein
MRPPYVPVARMPRRPGERREPLPFFRVPPPLAAKAAERGLDLRCAVELCLEQALLVRDLDELGRLSIYPQLLEIAAATRMKRALPAPKARYVQMLLAASGGLPVAVSTEPRTSDAIIDVPLRLFPRVLDVVEGTAFGATALDDAVRLEIASVSDGRSMVEWAALTALRLSP